MFSNSCQHCGNWHSGICPKVKAIEYYNDGTIKRVEYFGNEPVCLIPKEPENPFDFCGNNVINKLTW